MFGTAERRVIQQQLKYSQQSVAEPVVNRKKKYIYTALLGTSLIAFSYYVYKEKEYGKNAHSAQNKTDFVLGCHAIIFHVHKLWTENYNENDKNHRNSNNK